MGIGVEVLQVVDRPEAEPKDDLAEAVTLLLGKPLDLLEPDAVDVLGDQHPAARQPRQHVGDVDERVAAVGAGEGALALRLVLVVELLHHPQPQLLGDRLGVEAGGDRPREPHDHPGVAQVGLQRLGDPGVLDLDRHRAPVAEGGAVHLADRGGGERLGLDLGEQLVDRLAPVLLVEHLAHLLPGHRRRAGAQLGELLLVELRVLRRQELGVDERGELPHLHRRALHLAEDRGHLHGRLQVSRLQPGVGHLLRAGHVGGLGARVAGRLGADHRSQLRRAADPALGDLVLGHRTRVAAAGRGGGRPGAQSRRS